MRRSGVLLPISSLPSKYGIGCFSREAYEFVDFLQKAGQRDWQILPLGPTGYGDSPYQAFSTFAGNPYFIDLDALVEEGLLSQQECEEPQWQGHPAYVDYERIYNYRYPLLKKAFDRWAPDESFGEFVRSEGYWLEDYCLFMAIKDSQGGALWTTWPKELRDRQPGALQEAREKLADEIQFQRFMQYEFLKQWLKLKDYANRRDVQIIGDIPIYVSFDSADAWANPKLFQFTEDNQPVAVAGCPPDGFSPTGQLWGNPVYSWEYHRETEFSWWVQRVAHCFKLYDTVRIDHFRGFDEYYAIPYGHATAEFGHWEKGPGIELFHTLRNKLGWKDIIAEDLGFLTDSVLQMVRDTGYPGMKVLHFAFDPSASSAYLPHRYTTNCVVYTGTHDNDTTRHWLETLSHEERSFVDEYMNFRGGSVEDHVWALIKLAMGSVADLCVIPMQDYLCLGEEARLNQPSTFGTNWKWRLVPGQYNDQLAQRMHRMTKIYGRV